MIFSNLAILHVLTMTSSIAAFSSHNPGYHASTCLLMATEVKENEPFFVDTADKLGVQENKTLPNGETNCECCESAKTMNDDGSITYKPTPAYSKLQVLAKEQNPAIKFFDPLKLAQDEFWGSSNEATIGFLRHAEIKHGRVAMAAFVGYIVQSNWHFPWKMTLEGDDFPSVGMSPEEQWDAIPVSAKWQIILFVGFLEIWDEIGGTIVESPSLNMSQKAGLPHYMRGRMPGKYPSFQSFRDTVHWIPDLFNPAGFKIRSEAERAKGRNMEINNGRLAMFGIMGFLAADKVPGSVPLLDSVARSYAGNVMVPFSNDFTLGPLIVATATSNEVMAGVAVTSVSVGEGKDIAVQVSGIASKAADFVPELLNNL